MTVRDVCLIFEAKDYRCLGFWFRGKKLREFMVEFDDMFNNSDSQKILNNDILHQKMWTKHLKLQAMYISLLYGDGTNAKKEFKEMFGYDYDDKGLQKITDENNRLLTKIKLIKPEQKEEKKGVSFSKLIALIESSRDCEIDRNIKLFEFKEIHDIEIEKWQTSAA